MLKGGITYPKIWLKLTGGAARAGAVWQEYPATATQEKLYQQAVGEFAGPDD